MLNAHSNRLKGGGFEDCGADQNYTNCRIVFANVENIHYVKESYEKMCSVALRGYTDTRTWFTNVEQTGYFQLLRTILEAS